MNTASAWLAVFGCLGLGLVWGWLLVQVFQRFRWRQITQGWRELIPLLSAGLGTTLLGGAAWILTTLVGSLAFFCAAALAFVLHIAWRQTLKQKIHYPR